MQLKLSPKKDMRKSFNITLIIIVGLLATSNAFSLRLPQNVETYLRGLTPPKTTTSTQATITEDSKNDETEKSCWQDFSICYNVFYNLIAEHSLSE